MMPMMYVDIKAQLPAEGGGRGEGLDEVVASLYGAAATKLTPDVFRAIQGRQVLVLLGAKVAGLDGVVWDADKKMDALGIIKCTSIKTFKSMGDTNYFVEFLPAGFSFGFWEQDGYLTCSGAHDLPLYVFVKAA
jgi:hypothetical protein